MRRLLLPGAVLLCLMLAAATAISCGTALSALAVTDSDGSSDYAETPLSFTFVEVKTQTGSAQILPSDTYLDVEFSVPLDEDNVSGGRIVLSQIDELPSTLQVLGATARLHFEASAVLGSTLKVRILRDLSALDGREFGSLLDVLITVDSGEWGETRTASGLMPNAAEIKALGSPDETIHVDMVVAGNEAVRLQQLDTQSGEFTPGFSLGDGAIPPGTLIDSRWSGEGILVTSENGTFVRYFREPGSQEFAGPFPIHDKLSSARAASAHGRFAVEGFSSGDDARFFTSESGVALGNSLDIGILDGGAPIAQVASATGLTTGAAFWAYNNADSSSSNSAVWQCDFNRQTGQWSSLQPVQGQSRPISELAALINEPRTSSNATTVVVWTADGSVFAESRSGTLDWDGMPILLSGQDPASQISNLQVAGREGRYVLAAWQQQSEIDPVARENRIAVLDVSIAPASLVLRDRPLKHHPGAQVGISPSIGEDRYGNLFLLWAERSAFDGAYELIGGQFMRDEASLVTQVVAIGPFSAPPHFTISSTPTGRLTASWLDDTAMSYRPYN